MTVLCSNGCHVYRVGASACTCGLNLTKFPLSGGVIPSYNPYGPPRPPTPPVAGEAPDVSITVFKAAKDAGASHLSMDGKTIYVIRMGKVCWADWSEEAGAFSSWWATEAAEMPPDAAAM